MSSRRAHAILLVLALASTTLPATGGSSLVPILDPGPQADGEFGAAVAGLSDVNGDGIADVAVGAPGASLVRIVSGADRSLIRTLTDPESVDGTQFGQTLQEIGDVDDDGVADLAVGAPGPLGILPLPCVDPDDCPPDPEWGRVFLFSGRTGGLLRKILPTSSEFLLFGLSLAALGDVDSDGVPDLAVGAPFLLITSGARCTRSREPQAPSSG